MCDSEQHNVLKQLQLFVGQIAQNKAAATLVGTHEGCGGDVYSDGICYGCGKQVTEDWIMDPA